MISFSDNNRYLWDFIWYGKNYIISLSPFLSGLQSYYHILYTFFSFCTNPPMLIILINVILKINSFTLKSFLLSNFHLLDWDWDFLLTFFNFVFLFFFSPFVTIKYLRSGIKNSLFSFSGVWFEGKKGSGASTYSAFNNESVEAVIFPPNLYLIFSISYRISWLYFSTFVLWSGSNFSYEIRRFW